jgi:hypothetical protein
MMPNKDPSQARRSMLKACALGATSLGGALMASGCASNQTLASAPAVSLPRWRVGQRWAYHLIDGFSGQIIAKPSYQVIATAGQTVVRVQGLANAADRETYTPDLAIIDENTFDSHVRFEAPQPWFQSTKSNTRYQAAGDRNWFGWQQTVSWAGSEKINVTAGTYDCNIIKRDIYFTHPDPSRNGSHRIDTFWYSPVVERWVKREWMGTYSEPTETDMNKLTRGTRREIWRRWELVNYDVGAIS